MNNSPGIADYWNQLVADIDRVTNAPESVYFYTFHKCASSLFSEYLLRKFSGLRHVDYAKKIYNGKIKGEPKLKFRQTRHVYGPIRLSSGAESPEGKLLVQPLSQADFLSGKKAIFFVRDPRDVMVSMYFSFRHSHPFSKVDSIRARQEENRNRLLQMKLDEFVLSSMHQRKRDYEFMLELMSYCDDHVLLRYEDMISDFDKFSSELRKYVKVRDRVLKNTYLRSRPRQTEDVNSHRRSGQIGGFRDKLQAETIASVNRELSTTLAAFGYPL